MYRNRWSVPCPIPQSQIFACRMNALKVAELKIAFGFILAFIGKTDCGQHENCLLSKFCLSMDAFCIGCRVALIMIAFALELRESMTVFEKAFVGIIQAAAGVFKSLTICFGEPRQIPLHPGKQILHVPSFTRYTMRLSFSS